MSNVTDIRDAANQLLGAEVRQRFCNRRERRVLVMNEKKDGIIFLILMLIAIVVILRFL